VFGRAALSPPELVARLDEFVELLGRLFEDDVVSYSGDYYTVNEAVVHPPSVRSPHVPIAVAASGPKSIAMVARRADAWITLGDLRRPPEERRADPYEVVRRQVRRLDDECAAIGRDTAQVRRIFMTDEALGSASSFAAFASDLSDLGFTDVVLHHPRAGDPVWDEPDSIVDEIAETVIPRFR
jgi:alkanesulfonate monooxygenase SsuD/methylene tetrahydromethanopterin reductase-like flavin-dependent oxidoreductase (luciferase family)